jgi:hypothetical protein
VPEREPDATGLGVRPHPSLERLHDPGTGPPGDVEPRHGVAVAVGAAVAPLGPTDDREHPMAHPPQPGALLAGREVDVRLRPAARPEVLLTVELGAAHPVGEGQVVAVVHPHPALLGGVDEEQPTQAPERLAAERLLGLLVDQHHRASGVRDLRRGGQAGEPVAHDDHIGVHGWRR